MEKPQAATPRDKATENCDLLFEYLRSILYDSDIQQPDLAGLDAPYEKLGKGLFVLQRFVEELKSYSEALSNGELSNVYPSRDNFLCANLKNLHANLNHLTWQAKCVAEGDYSQHVSYLGEFSVAFNTMIRQLKVREESLHEQIEKTQRQMSIIDQYNHLFTDMMTRRNVWFVVVDSGSGSVLYCNRQSDLSDDACCENCSNKHNSLRDILCDRRPNAYEVWEWGNEQSEYFRISSLPIEWRGKSAFAHVAEEITEEKRTEDRLMDQAYHDVGTGIYNRLFFEEHLSQQLRQHKALVLCFMDLDGLKYVNDNFGHSEGDNYIRRFVTTIRDSFRETDILARIGGDEFCLLLPDVELETMRTKLEQVRDHFIADRPSAYPGSFSYGLVQFDGSSDCTADELLEKADSRMYEYKKKNKPPGMTRAR